MNKLSYRTEITRVVLEQNESDLPLQDALKKWWFSPRGGLRLTSMGDLEFRYSKIEYYNHDFRSTNKSWYAFVLDLDKKINCPYYVDVNKSDKGHVPFIRLYDSRIAMMLNLYGDLDSYLDSIKVRR